MFVVWRRRTKRGRQWPEDRDARLEARLVEGMRIDGKPRQRFIVYIGSIEEPYDSGDRVDFWDVASHVLDHLGNRIGAERSKIEASLAAKVPRPTAKERRTYVPRLERWLKRRDEVRAEKAAEPVVLADTVLPSRRHRPNPRSRTNS